LLHSFEQYFLNGDLIRFSHPVFLHIISPLSSNLSNSLMYTIFRDDISEGYN